MNTRQEQFIFACILGFAFIATVIAYYPGLSGDYMFDDFPNILDNPSLTIHSLAPDELLAATFSSDSGPLNRPVAMLSFALNHYFFGPGPYSFKVTNVAIHLMNGALLFIFTLFLLKGYREVHPQGFSDAAIRWLALTAAAAWMLHPLNLTSVLYIVQRMTSLAALFTIATLCVYVYGRFRILRGRPGLTIILLGMPVFGLLSILSKENAVLLPLYICVVEVCIFRFRAAGDGIDRRVLALFVGTLLVFAIATLLWLLPNAERVFAGYEARSFTLIERLLTEARVVLLYLKWIIYPNIQELGLYHDDIAVSTGLFTPPITAVSLLGILGLAAIAVSQYNKRPLITLGLAWFFVGHSLESTIIALEMAHEHRNYLPDYGILLALTSLLLLPGGTTHWIRTRYAITISALILFSAVTCLRSYQWTDNISHAQYEASHHPESPRAVSALGRIYANLAISGYLDDDDRVFTTLERAGQLDDETIMPEATLMLVAARLDRPLEPSWLTRASAKLATGPLSPSDITALHELAQCPNGRCPISDAQMKKLFQSAQRSTGLAQMRCRHADLLTIYANHLTNQRRQLRNAFQVMTRVKHLCPREPQFRINVARISLALGRKQQAGKEIQALKDMNQFRRLSRDIALLEFKLAEVRN